MATIYQVSYVPGTMKILCMLHYLIVQYFYKVIVTVLQMGNEDSEWLSNLVIVT